MAERTGELTFKGSPLTLVGPRLQPGDTAPDFTLVGTDLTPKTLSDAKGKAVLLSVVPSLDTSVCDAQTRKVSEEIGKLGADVVCFTVSADLPFAQARWCGGAGVDNLICASDHMDMNFGDAYGTHIKEWRMDSRAMFVVGKDGKITYCEYVPEVAQHPDYDAALGALKEAAQG